MNRFASFALTLLAALGLRRETPIDLPAVPRDGGSGSVRHSRANDTPAGIEFRKFRAESKRARKREDLRTPGTMRTLWTEDRPGFEHSPGLKTTTERRRLVLERNARRAEKRAAKAAA